MKQFLLKGGTALCAFSALVAHAGDDLEHVTAIGRNDAVVEWGTLNGQSISLGFIHQF